MQRSRTVIFLINFVSICPVCLSFFSLSALATPHTDAPQDLDERLDDAAQKRHKGLFSESADLYAKAYRSRPEPVRSDMIGEIIVRNAVMDYQNAYETNPSDITLLEEQALLLEEFLQARKQVYIVGSIAAIPFDMGEQLEELHTKLREFQQKETAHETPIQGREPEPPQGKLELPQSRLTNDRNSRPPEKKLGLSRKRPKNDRKADIAALTLGMTSTVGGGVLLGLGGWHLVRTSGQARAELLNMIKTDPRLPQHAKHEEALAHYRNAIDQWGDRGHSIGVAQVVIGSVLTATGIGLTTWGALRWIKRNKRTTRNTAYISPVVTYSQFGLQMIF